MEVNKENQLKVMKLAQNLILNEQEWFVCLAIQEASIRLSPVPGDAGYDVRMSLESMVRERIGGKYTAEDFLFPEEEEKCIRLTFEQKEELYAFRVKMIEDIIAELESK